MPQKLHTPLLLLLFLVAGIFTATASPVRVVCIGDSITQGRGNKTASGGEVVPTDGWRYAFWKDCVEAGHPIEFVGSIKTGFESTPVYADFQGQKFSNLHEARWGWTTEQLRDQIKKTSADWTADLALVYLGTNREPATEDEKASDPEGAARTTAAMREIVEILRADNPKIAIVLRSPGGDVPRSQKLEAAYQKLAKELGAPASPISAVLQGADWQWDPKAANTDTVDGCHPNTQGDKKIADGFFQAAQGVLSAPGR
ncbi:MAG: GDSL-type esterase/lipase family protein [Verrucomicrobia bacterium]|nr:GDSL-type esterase/lipase family protein [Verrucomicrobiota bacterium]